MKRIALVSLGLSFLWLLASCSSGPKVSLDPESRAFYETAQLIMTSAEKDIFTHLADAEARKEFIKDFWDKRDPDPDTEGNEFKQAFLDRIDYANKHFKEGPPGWKTDRGRILIYLGPPDKFEEIRDHGEPEIRGPILIWYYYDYEAGVEFADEKGDGTFKIRQYEGNFFAALDSLMLGAVPNLKGGKRKFANFKLKYVPQEKAIEIRIPAEAFNFRQQAGTLRADLTFQVFVYAKNGPKVEEFKDRKEFAEPEGRAVELKEVVISLPHDFAPGIYYLDVIIESSDGTLGKTRKIFEIRVNP